MLFGWQTSLAWELTLWIGLMVLFIVFPLAVFLGDTARIESRNVLLGEFKSAWWNERTVLWIFFFLWAATPVLLATLGIIVFFAGAHPARGVFNVIAEMVSNYPLLSLLWGSIIASTSSLAILRILFSAMTRSNRLGVWMVKHSVRALAIIAFFVLVVQALLILVSLGKL